MTVPNVLLDLILHLLFMVDEGIQFSQIPAEIDMHKDAWRVARIMTIPLCYLYI
jgi:hypothetical protein